MKFSALPVKVGDSFLLRTNDQTILVDGGMNKKDILVLLEKEKIPDKHIDLLVCTHYDADHINGIIGILESGQYSFKEIWLPEILGSIGYSLSKNIEKIFHGLRNNDINHDMAFYNYENSNMGESLIFDEYNSEAIDSESPKNNSLEKINHHVLDDIDSYINALFYGEMFYIGWKDYHLAYEIFTASKSIANLVSYSLSSGAYIRWFKYKEGAPRKTYGFDMFAENSIQTDISLFDQKLLLKALYAVSLSRINKFSLVYRHSKTDFPEILFTADSDLSFTSNPLVLEPGSIVTAPHHGSGTNDVAYSKILGNDLIFVRSDRSQLTRPGRGYLSTNIHYCTICRNITSKQKLEFDFVSTTFRTTARKCIC